MTGSLPDGSSFPQGDDSRPTPEPQNPTAYPYTPPPPFGNPEYPPTGFPAAPGYDQPPEYGPPPAYGYDYLAGNLVPPPPPRKSRPGLWIAIPAAVAVAAVAIAVAVIATQSATTSGRPALGPSTSDTATTGVLVQSKAGQFQARFPSQPLEQTVPESIGGINISVHVARISDPITEVATETTSTTIPSDQYQTTMRIALTTFAVPGNLTVDGQTEVTFRGHPARTGTFTAPDGVHITAIVFFYSGTRVYYLVGQTGAPFDELVASFVALA